MVAEFYVPVYVVDVDCSPFHSCFLLIKFIIFTWSDMLD